MTNQPSNRIPKAKIRALGFYAHGHGNNWALYRIGDKTQTPVARGFKTQQEAHRYAAQKYF